MDTGHTPPTVAALYVDPHGAYANLPGVEVWDEARDARLYAGPWPVVAHPPCAAWSRLAGFREARFGYKRGEDGGCFKAALAAVREHGGVLEHPAYSDAWSAFGLPRPKSSVGWTVSFDGEASCYIEQGSYGLPIPKPTWLYAYGVDLPELRWGGTWHRRYDRGYEGESQQGADGWNRRVGPRAGKPLGLTAATPPAFRDVLLAMARSAAPVSDEAER